MCALFVSRLFTVTEPDVTVGQGCSTSTHCVYPCLLSARLSDIVSTVHTLPRGGMYRIHTLLRGGMYLVLHPQRPREGEKSLFILTPGQYSRICYKAYWQYSQKYLAIQPSVKLPLYSLWTAAQFDCWLHCTGGRISISSPVS